MEYVEFIPGGLAAAWMVFRMAVLVIHGPPPESTEQGA
jgi:hypothetical protein